MYGNIERMQLLRNYSLYIAQASLIDEGSYTCNDDGSLMKCYCVSIHCKYNFINVFRNLEKKYKQYKPNVSLQQTL